MATTVFELDPDELTRFGRYLTTTTEPEINAAADTVRAANGFNNDAFGIFLAQILAIPARIALGMVADDLAETAREVGDAGWRTAKAAAEFEAAEAHAGQRVARYKVSVAA